jgi:hypothetical protein
VRVHLAGKHALELDSFDVALEAGRIATEFRERRLVSLGLGQLEELERAGESAADPVEPAQYRLEFGPLAPQGFGARGLLPDLRVLEFAAYFGEPFELGVVLKDTPEGPRGAPRDP